MKEQTRLKNRLFIILSFTLFLPSFSLFSQNDSGIDSIITRLENMPESLEKTGLYLEAAKKIIKKDIGLTIVYAKEAEKLAFKLSDKKSQIKALLIQTRGFTVKGLLDSAKHTIEKAIDISSKNKFTSLLAVANMYRGNVLLDVNEHGEAIQSYLCALQFFKKQKNKRAMSGLYNNIGGIYAGNNEYETAILYYQKAIFLTDSNSGRYYSAVYNLASAYKNEGKYDKALQLYRQSLSFEQKQKDTFNLSKTYNGMALLYKAKKDYSMALDYLQKALSLKERVGNPKFISSTMNNIASVQNLIGEYEKAILTSQKSYDLAQKANSKHEIFYALDNLCLAQEKNGNYLEALRICNLICSYADASFFSANEVFKKNVDARKYSIPIVKNSSYFTFLIPTISSKAQIFTKYRKVLPEINQKESLQLAIKHYQACDTLIEQVRQQILSETDKSELGKKSSVIYTDAIDVCLQLREIDKKANLYYQNLAFEFAEKNKAGILEEAIAGVDLDTGIVRNAKLAIGKYRTKLAETNNDSLESLYRQELLDAYEVLRKNEQKDKRLVESASINDIQQKLNSSTALVEYVISDSALYTFLIKKEGFEIFTTKLDQSIEELADKFLQSIIDGEKEDFINYGKQLNNLLIAPLKLNEQVKELVIIPDGKLGLIPFEALLNEKPTKSNTSFDMLNYLIKEYAVSYHYSASLWLKSLEMSDEKKNVQESILACAPVTFEHGQNKYLMPENASITKSGFQPLYETEAEVNEIVSSFKSKGFLGRALKNAYANEVNLKTEALNYKYIHLSTHGISDSIRPQLSRVLLAQPMQKDSASILDEIPSRYKEDDGFLYAGEMFFMDLKKCDLFVLSACETGVGKVSSGEGVMALHRGLMYAGAPNIIYSLWKIPEKESKDLMIDFYKEMHKGKFKASYAETLRNAKLKMIKQGKKPLFWAGMALIGN